MNTDSTTDGVLAHKNGGYTQSLKEHAERVAGLAGRFAAEFGNEDWAAFAGLFHDLGKAHPEWQKYIRGEIKATSVNHSEAGAQYVYQKLKEKYPGIQVLALSVPYVIAGHHAGLPDYYNGSGNSLKSVLFKKDSFSNLQIPENLHSPFLPEVLPCSLPFAKKQQEKDYSELLPEQFHLWIRMLYSCLIDADFLDTEKFMNPDSAGLRGGYAGLPELKHRFDRYMTEKIVAAAPSEINCIRNSVFQLCKEKAVHSPGFFSLHVPTGGGKTLSAMAFALEHALVHKKKRIIFAIPYTSIIEQTAKVYKYGSDDNAEIAELIKQGKILFGEENVLEHHCNFDFETDSESEILKRQKLATENWDAPVIVTTNVQLFESLFCAHNSSCRKLHNLTDSILILDEVQMLPPEFLHSILSVLQGLVKYLGVTVVLCTATQPVITGKIGSDLEEFTGIPENQIIPIIPDPEKLAALLERVQINTDYVKNKAPDWQAIACKLCEFTQVLCIVQTRKDCRDLHRLMPEGTFHLSALMCAEERSEIISEIKRKLRAGDPVRVISTQLVECGVDIDFPVVFRALAGMDSVAQAAGRCNREGKQKYGTLFLFDPPSPAPRGLLGKAAEVTRDILEKRNYTLTLSTEVCREYFEIFFRILNAFDKPDFKGTMQKEKRDGRFQFRTLSDHYHLIDNLYQETVYVKYCSPVTGKDNSSLLQKLQAQEFSRNLFRSLARYSVTLPQRSIRQLLQEGRLLEAGEGIFMQNLQDKSLYQPGLGLCPDSDPEFEALCF